MGRMSVSTGAVVRQRTLPNTAWDIWRAGHGGQWAVAARQQARLADLVEFARTRSPLYGRLYDRVPVDVRDVRELPPVTKSELMASFDDWMTDATVTRASAKAFAADTTLVGHPYLGRYAIWTTSGVSGEPGIFVHDGDALTVYGALAMVRGILAWLTPRRFCALMQRGVREMSVVATGGHFAGAVVKERLYMLHPWLSGRSYTFSALMPLPELVRALNEVQPTILISYPTAMTLLVHEQMAGRLRINPVLVATAAEWLAPEARAQIAAAFSCPVRDGYAASEFLGIAFDCEHGWLHVNADWVILEPVDEAYQAVPPGQASCTALLTNLANRVQPIIRYDLGDSITVSPDPYPCGSPLPALHVEGRRDEILYLQASGGEAVPLLPMALATVVEQTPGVRRFQVIQTAPATLTVRLNVAAGTDDALVWEMVARRLQDYLSGQGLPWVTVERAPEPPERDPNSGKFRQVWANAEAADS